MQSNMAAPAISRFSRFFRSFLYYSEAVAHSNISNARKSERVFGKIQCVMRPGFKVYNNARFSRTVILHAGLLSFLGLTKDDEEKEDPIIHTIKLGILNLQMEDFNKAEKLLHLALKMAQEQQNNQAETYIYSILANVAFEKGDGQKAETLFKEVMQRVLATGASKEDNSIVEMSLKLAAIYAHRGENEKARLGFQYVLGIQGAKAEALPQTGKLTPEEENDLALWGMCVDWYAHYLMEMKDYVNAKAQIQKAIDVSTRVLGPREPTTLKLINDFAVLLIYQEQYDEALRKLKPIVKTAKELQSPDYPVYLTNLGTTYIYRDEPGPAERVCKDALRIAKEISHTIAVQMAQECLDEIKRRQKAGSTT